MSTHEKLNSFAFHPEWYPKAPFICPFESCEHKKSLSRNGLRWHIRYEHTEQEYPAEFLTKMQSIPIPPKISKNRKTSQKGKTYYVCHKKNDIKVTNRDFKKPFRCPFPQCKDKKPCSSLNSLRFHITHQHEEKELPNRFHPELIKQTKNLSMMDYTINDIKILKKHFPTGPYVCPICNDKKFRGASALNSLRIHVHENHKLEEVPSNLLGEEKYGKSENVLVLKNPAEIEKNQTMVLETVVIDTPQLLGIKFCPGCGFDFSSIKKIEVFNFCLHCGFNIELLTGALSVARDISKLPKERGNRL